MSGPVPTPIHARALMRRATGGFSLFEVVIVVAVLALAAAAVGASLGRSGSGTRQRSAVDGIVSTLAMARLDAMRSQSRVRVELVPLDRTGSMRITAGDRSAEWSATGLAPALGLIEQPPDVGGVRRATTYQVVDERANTGRAAPLEAVFDSAGRADRPLWRLAEDRRNETSSAPSRNAAGTPERAWDPASATPVGSTLWTVQFDAVSGTPTAQRAPKP